MSVAEAWVKSHAKELIKLGIDPLTLTISTELKELKPAMINIRNGITSDDLLKHAIAPPQGPLQGHIVRTYAKIPLEPYLGLLNAQERYIYQGTANGTTQKVMGQHLSLTQGAVSAAVETIASKLKRLKVIRSYDFTHAIMQESTEHRRKILTNYLQHFDVKRTTRETGAPQPTISGAIGRLMLRIPQEVREALNPRKPLKAIDCSDRRKRQGRPVENLKSKPNSRKSIMPRAPLADPEGARSKALKTRYEKKSGHKL